MQRFSAKTSMPTAILFAFFHILSKKADKMLELQRKNAKFAMQYFLL